MAISYCTLSDGKHTYRAIDEIKLQELIRIQVIDETRVTPPELQDQLGRG